MGGWVVSSFYQNKSKILYIFPPSKPANILLWSPGWPSASVHPPALDWARYILLSISQIMSLCLPTTVKIILLRKDNNLQEDILSLHSQVLTVHLIQNRKVSLISKGFGKKLIPKTTSHLPWIWTKRRCQNCSKVVFSTTNSLDVVSFIVIWF